jgi:glycosyltransferase involved in cell wall biosynthesis
MNIALVYPENEPHGIADQIFRLADALDDLRETHVNTMPLVIGRQPTAYYVELAAKLNAPEIDVIHLPHEYGFYGGILPKTTGFWELRYLLKKPVVMTAYNVEPMEVLLADENKTLSQRLANALHFRSTTTRDAVEIAPFATTYTIVSTNYERNVLIERGAKPQYVTVIPDGIPNLTDESQAEIAAKVEEFAFDDCVAFSAFDWRHRNALGVALVGWRPILAPNTPIIQEIWSRRDCLERYAPGDAADFRAKLAALSENIERRTVLSAQARRYAERYSVARIAPLTRRVYEAAISVF